jgi:hypothetical protein
MELTKEYIERLKEFDNHSYLMLCWFIGRERLKRVGTEKLSDSPICENKESRRDKQK